MHVQQLMAFFRKERRKEGKKERRKEGRKERKKIVKKKIVKKIARERGRNKKRKKRIVSLASCLDPSSYEHSTARLHDTANYIIQRY